MGGLLGAEVVDEDRRALGYRQQGVLLDLRVGWQYALCESLHHGPRKTEILLEVC